MDKHQKSTHTHDQSATIPVQKISREHHQKQADKHAVTGQTRQDGANKSKQQQVSSNDDDNAPDKSLRNDSSESKKTENHGEHKSGNQNQKNKQS